MSNLKVTKVTASTWEDTDGVEFVPCRAMATITAPSTGTSIITAKNISSIVDNGAGDTTFNFTKAMPNANYAIAYSWTDQVGGNGNAKIHASSATTAPTLKTASAVRLTTSWDVHTLTMAIFV